MKIKKILLKLSKIVLICRNSALYIVNKFIRYFAELFWKYCIENAQKLDIHEILEILPCNIIKMTLNYPKLKI